MTPTPEQLAREMEEALRWAKISLEMLHPDAEPYKISKALLALRERCEKAEAVLTAGDYLTNIGVPIAHDEECPWRKDKCYCGAHKFHDALESWRKAKEGKV